MPLTLELYGSSNLHTKLIIDRNNLIFGFPLTGDSSTFPILHEARKRLSDAINKNEELEAYKKPDLFGAGDPRYYVQEHMCNYDNNELYHYHLVFNKDVSFKLLSKILNHLALIEISDLISEECIDTTLETAKQYFEDLEYDHMAKLIEIQYRDEKNAEMAVMNSSKRDIINPENLQNHLLYIIRNTIALTDIWSSSDSESYDYESEEENFNFLPPPR